MQYAYLQILAQTVFQKLELNRDQIILFPCQRLGRIENAHSSCQYSYSTFERLRPLSQALRRGE